jgi:cobalt/nickel transport system permease protein
MGEWLFNRDNYKPKKDSDNFMDKTISAMLKILSKVKREYNYSSRFMYKLNPVLKVIFSLFIIICISISRGYLYTLSIMTFVLILLCFMDVENMLKILKMAVVVPVFTFIMLIPSIVYGNISNSLLIVIKIFVTLLIVNILSNTTKWSQITKALKVFYIPDIFLLIFDITIKYIYILGEFSLDMFYALKLRSVGKNNSKYVSISKIMGNLFIKSKDMGEDMYSAMECRGFTGEYKSISKFSFSFYDFLYSAVSVSLILLYFLIGRM